MNSQRHLPTPCAPDATSSRRSFLGRTAAALAGATVTNATIAATSSAASPDAALIALGHQHQALVDRYWEREQARQEVRS